MTGDRFPRGGALASARGALGVIALLLALAAAVGFDEARAAGASTPIALGGNFSCGLAGGGVKCWGYNGDGQLGDGTTTQRSAPADVNGLSSGVAAIAAGASHSCALTVAGAAKCWGHNYYGQVGDGSYADRNTPADVSGLSSGVAALTAGSSHTCAVTASGAAKCWGRNEYGQTGDGSPSALGRMTAVDVAGLSSGVAAKWYFYSPLLESSGGLAAVKSFADGHSHLHFDDDGKLLGIGVGFWVSRP